METNTDIKGNAITNEAAQAFIQSITPGMIREVYSGKPGCMCGCRGKYSVNPTHKDEADKERGYEQPIGAGMRMISKVLKLMKENPRAMVQHGSIVFFPCEEEEKIGRNYVIYLCDAATI